MGGGFGGDSADFLGINDKRLMMEVLDAKDLRFWKESEQTLASTFSLHLSSILSKEMKRVNLPNEH